MSLLNEVGIPSYPLPVDIDKNYEHNDQKNLFIQKKYPSERVPLTKRFELINQMILPISKQVLYEHEVISLERFKDSLYNIKYVNPNGQHKNIVVEHVILALGKAGNQTFRSMCCVDMPYVKLKYEAGCRIETTSDNEFFNNFQENDIKLIMKTEECEYRTFCTCRNGEIHFVPHLDYTSLSGRSDTSKTEFSNFSLLVKYSSNVDKDEWWCNINKLMPKTYAIWQPLVEIIEKRSIDFNYAKRPWFPKDSFIRDDIENRLGEDIFFPLRKGLSLLINQFPFLLNKQTVCILPAIESSLFYINVDTSLKVDNNNIWVAGDQTGLFRGIIPALISGYFVGKTIN